MKVLLIRRKDDPKKGVFVEMDCITRVGEDVYFEGESNTVRDVTYFLDSDFPFYKKNIPFVRLVFYLYYKPNQIKNHEQRTG